MREFVNVPNKLLMDFSLNNKTKNIIILFHSMRDNKNEVRLTLPEITQYTDVKWKQQVTVMLKKASEYYTTTKVNTPTGKCNFYIVEKPMKDYTGIPIDIYRKYRNNSEITVNYAKLKFADFLLKEGGNLEPTIDDYMVIGKWKAEEFVEALKKLRGVGLIKDNIRIEFLAEGEQKVEIPKIKQETINAAEIFVTKFYEMSNKVPTVSQRNYDVNTVKMAFRDNQIKPAQAKVLLDYMVNVKKFKNLNNTGKSIVESHYYGQLESPIGKSIKRYYDGMNYIIEYNMLKSNFEHAENVMRNFNLTQDQLNFVVEHMIRNKVEVFNYIDNTIQAAMREWRNKKGNVSFNNPTPVNPENQLEALEKMLEKAQASGNEFLISSAQRKIEEFKNMEVK